jgi:peptide/nickel transport system substrate-binding protein
VTYRDFVYTLRQIDDPRNNVASREGYDQLDPANFLHKGEKRVTFFWRKENCTADSPCGPYGRWQGLFAYGSLYPARALAGRDFNDIWMDCICGNDGKPVSDGPFYLSNYTKGHGMTLKRNPFWYGRKPGLREVDLVTIADTSAEVQAMRRGKVDAIAPTFGQNLVPLQGAPGITFKASPGYYMEHLEFNEGAGSSNPLLRAPWMRKAIALAIDRQSLIETIYGPLSGNLTPLNNIEFYSSEAPYKSDFVAWSYNPRKAVAILSRHCTGGPAKPSASNSAVWQCSGFAAQFRYSWTTGNRERTLQEAIIKAELKSIGIGISDYPEAATAIFSPSGLPSGDFDIADFAWLTSGDPSDFYDVWRCGGGSNYTHYCSARASALLNAGEAAFDPAKRVRDFQIADAVFAADVPAFPLYERPVPLVYRSRIAGMAINAGAAGPFWNVEDWRWKSSQ